MAAEGGVYWVGTLLVALFLWARVGLKLIGVYARPLRLIERGLGVAFFALQSVFFFEASYVDETSRAWGHGVASLCFATAFVLISVRRLSCPTGGPTGGRKGGSTGGPAAAAESQGVRR